MEASGSTVSVSYSLDLIVAGAEGGIEVDGGRALQVRILTR